ncbi:hypothetical protein D7S70_18475 [Ralstonia pickettii]|nr:hypothetical protein [Ralstonia pickettii]MBB0036300.1 hypothetical protein [Ralstonia pickettii]MBB0099000.1 hypothetical protein [Ralstonia pickettii]MBB0129774.1 hypothetical protein [Ralstonia pickettii]MBB0163563.1 hypothetical protein [Ralstonia pickettii]
MNECINRKQRRRMTYRTPYTKIFFDFAARWSDSRAVDIPLPISIQIAAQFFHIKTLRIITSQL